MSVTVALSCLLLASPQGAPAPEILNAQAERTAMIERVAAAVCTVMPLGASGGGSGVVIDPAGFVLSNFHVVQRRKQRGKPKPEAKPKAEPKPYRLTAEQIDELRRTLPAEAQSRLPTLTPDQPLDANARHVLLQLWLEYTPKFLPPPRYDALPVDTDGDDPAWAVMKCGLPDGQLYVADVLGIDPGSDLALLKLRDRPDGKPFPFARLGNSDRLLVGENVFAMGNPFLLANDFQPTVTEGIVSGTHRYQPGGANRFLVYPDCIQIDAPINPGNSGGPLFNATGEVVGINGRISLRDRGRVNVGVGFAIASAQIRNFLGDMLAGRHCEHGTLDLNAWFMAAPGDGDGARRGVFVQSIFADSVVSEIGVRLGDELTSFDGVPIRGANQLATMVGVLPAGSWIELGFRTRKAGKWQPEQRKLVRLTRLDTGSSRRPGRLAPEPTRLAAAKVLVRAMGLAGLPGKESEPVGYEFRGPNGERERYLRAGHALRIESTERVVLRTAKGDVHMRPTSADDHQDSWLPGDSAARALLNRAERGLLLLAEGSGRLAKIAGAPLLGGVHVLGRPAYRFALDAKPKQEAWLYPNGSVAGATWRDPVRKHRVTWRIEAPGDDPSKPRRVRRGIGDQTPEAGWTLHRLVAVDPELLRGPNG